CQCLPFENANFGGVRDGLLVLVSGSVPYFCQRFQINFQVGSWWKRETDVAFHFNPRFDQHCVVFNSFEGGKWQHEEKSDDLPFHKGEAFEIRFLVSVNGKHFGEFKHRIPMSQVDTLGISGDVEVTSITFQGSVVSCKVLIASILKHEW
uniref:Galectin n=1 Tax=Salvator merianae TaxID=96440 RepID=A0A8D0ATJ3_SALMN